MAARVAHPHVKPQNMLLARDQALCFIEGYKSALLQVLHAAEIERTDSIIGDLADARKRVKQQPMAMEEAFAAMAAQGIPLDGAVVQAIRTMRVKRWVYLRHTRQAAIFIDEEVKNVFAVKALTTPIYEVVDSPPSTFEAGVFEYCGHYVCDGIILNPVMLGPGYGAQFKAAYAEIRKAGRYHVMPAA